MRRNQKSNSRGSSSRSTSLKIEKLSPQEKLERIHADCEKYFEDPEISGYEQGWLFKRIVNLIRCNGVLYFYVEWTNNKVQLLPAEEVKLWHAQEVIAFFEKITKWDAESEAIPKQIKIEIEEPEPLFL